MAESEDKAVPPDVAADREIDRQVARLRELLEMIGPETGSAALGSMRKAAPHVPFSERVRALSSYRR